MEKALVKVAALFNAEQDDLAEGGAVDVAMNVLLGDELRPILRVLTIVSEHALEDA